MFKYGSAKIFFIKIFFGLILISFSFFVLISLASQSVSDPGFKKAVNTKEINNLFGYYGAIWSSIIITFLGHISYPLFLFFLYSGIKFLLGVIYRRFWLRIISIIIASFLFNLSVGFFDFSLYKTGLLYDFLNKQSYSYYEKIFSRNFSYYPLIAVSFLISFFMIFFSFGLSFSYLKKIKIVLYPLRFINIIKPTLVYNFFLSMFSTNNKNKRTFKSEPTFQGRKERGDDLTKYNYSGDYKKLSDNYKFITPDYSILLKSTKKESYNREVEKNNKTSAIKLEKALLEYGVEGEIINYKTGPIVTLFEFVPKAGVKANKIISLADDISRAMSSVSARISAQPGKISLGIEIPNPKRESVFFGDIVDDERFKRKDKSLKLALGKNISGEKIFADLEKMPHLLIAGTTGSGKSVGINAMILSLLYRFTPSECKLILIDPKMLELSIYEDIPHLLTPVVTDPNKAVFALKWVVREMENRYKLMSSLNVKNINSYNEKVLNTLSAGRKLFRKVQTGIDSETRNPIIEKREIVLENMPLIVVVIDEMADLMMVAGKEVESLVQRLAQMARASGIHLITATQRPSVDVITGTIKANFPSRISFKVASKFDSRTIINEMGAEQLLGSGDMLFLENGANLKRLHGGFVSELEVERVVKFIKEQATFDQNKEISLTDENINSSGNLNIDESEVDELYNKAVDIIISHQKVSTSYIQRYLQIGYNRAARIVEKMEENGIISEANNAGKRQVLKKK